VQVIEQVDAACIADGEAALTGTQDERLEQVALAGAGLAREDEVVSAAYEVEGSELEDETAVELGWKGKSKASRVFFLLEPAAGEATRDALLELACSLLAEDAFEERTVGPSGFACGERR